MESMFKSLLEEKPIIEKNNEKIVDLTFQNYVPKKKKSIARVYTLTEEYDARPDKLSETVYNSSTFADLVLKTSDISNPFSLSSGDIIIVYELVDSLQDFNISEEIEKNKEDIIRNQYIDETKKTKLDEKINVFRNEKPKLPPNITKSDTEDIVIKNGKVILGDNVTKKNSCLKPIMSKSEVLSLLLKNKLNNNQVL
jgi:hypothetical protein